MNVASSVSDGPFAQSGWSLAPLAGVQSLGNYIRKWRKQGWSNLVVRGLIG